MKTFYQFAPENLHNSYIGEYIAYKIIAISNAGNIVMCIHDAFTRPDYAEAFVSLCNKKHVSYIHLPDVLYDTL